jgi:hypothetical protein
MARELVKSTQLLTARDKLRSSGRAQIMAEAASVKMAMYGI